MRIYGVEFKITEESIDKASIYMSPGEGVIIPLALERISGFYDYLVRNRCIRKKRINMIYIFSHTEYGEALCVKYLNGDVSVIQDVGKVDFCQNFLHNNI